jgi:hypothetical protein
MSRWNLKARDAVPQSKLLEQEPRGEGRRLSNGEVRFERLALAADMLRLALADGKALPPSVQETMQGLYQALLQLRAETRSLP